MTPALPATLPRDEMVDGAGGLRHRWRDLLGALAALPDGGLADGGLADRALRLDRAVEEEGIASLVPAGEPGAATWRCDPIPLLLTGAEFDGLEAGLAQRATLLDAVLRDVQGPGTLLAEGLLPAEMVFANPGFLRACRARGEHAPAAGGADGSLIRAYAADLERGADGAWRVVTDKVTRMGGLAQALENRRLLARALPEIFRGVPLRPLRPYVEWWSDGLRDAVPGLGEGSVALLTPGSAHPLWAEHAVLARALGCPLVEPGDLSVRSGRLWLKTLRGLRAVTVLLRRMEGRMMDPLEFGGTGGAGITGLMDAARHGAVRILNDPGAGLLEAPGLPAFLPALCRRLLGEALLLDSAETRWLGDGGGPPDPAAGWLLRPASDPDASPPDAARAAASPRDWCATRPPAGSLAPSWTGAGREGRPVRLRLFLNHDGTCWRALPGGLAQVAPAAGAPAARLPARGVSKDVWVLDEELGPAIGVGVATAVRIGPRRATADLTSRAADDLFWLGRYVERLDNAARLSRSALHRLERDVLLPHELAELSALARCLVPAGLATEEDAPAGGDAAALRRALLRAAGANGALPRAFARIARLVEATRDRQTGDMRDAFLAPLREMQDALPDASRDLRALSRVLGQALRYASGVAGVASENMVRGGAHTFLDLGRRLERAGAVSESLALALDQRPERLEAGLRLALELCDSVITYRDRYHSAPQAGPTLDLVLADENNPRGLARQLELARDLLETVAGEDDPLPREASRLLRDARSIAADAPSAVPARLRILEERVGHLSEAVSRRYFTLLPPLRSLGPSMTSSPPPSPGSGGPLRGAAA